MSRFCPLLYAALTLAATAVSAQAPTVRLHHQRKMGDKWTRTSSSNMNLLFNVLGTTSDGTMSADESTVCEVTGANADGSLEVKRTQSVTAHFSGIPNVPAEVKRESPASTFAQDASGKVTRSDVPRPELNADVAQHINEVFGYYSAQIPPLEEFPDRDLSVGDEWTNTYAFKGLDDRDAKVTLHSRLFSYDPNSGDAWIIQDGDIPTDFELGAQAANLHSTGGEHLHAMYLFNAKQGKVLRGSQTTSARHQFSMTVNGMKIEFGMEMTGSGTMNQ